MSLASLSPDQIDALYIRAKKELSKIPGVMGVGFGYQVKAGELTATLAFIVDVVAKKPLAELSAEEVVPSTFEGVPVDVQLVATATKQATCANLTQYGTLVGGAAISHQKTPGVFSIGTLGCFVLLNDATGLDRYGILSNNHVLCDAGATVGESIYQPARIESGASIMIDGNKIGGVVAKVYKEGKRGNHSYVYPEDVAGGAVLEDYYVDAATAKISTSFSSWCGTNVGTGLKNEIDGLSIGGSSAIAGVARLKASDVAGGTYAIWKVGATTGKTKGFVTNIAKTVGTDKNTIEITFDSASCAGVTRFSDQGDSGSVYVNSSRMVVGLHDSGSLGSPTISYGCHIHPVLDCVKACVLSEANWPKPGSDTILNQADSLALNPLPALRARLQGHPQEESIMAAIEGHRQELVHLVNHCRPVTVAWQRGRGPSFMGHYLHALHHPDHAIPDEIGGYTRAQSMQMVLEMLEQHGSPTMKADIDRYGAQLISQLAGARSLEEALSPSTQNS